MTLYVKYGCNDGTMSWFQHYLCETVKSEKVHVK